MFKTMPYHSRISTAQDVQIAVDSEDITRFILHNLQLLHAAQRNAADVETLAVFDYGLAAVRKRNFYPIYFTMPKGIGICQ